MILYYLLDMIDPMYALCVQELKDLHKENNPQTMLSIVYSNDMTEALIKVDNSKMPVNGSCILEIFDESKTDLLLKLIYTNPSWDIDQRSLAQKLSIDNQEKIDRTS